MVNKGMVPQEYLQTPNLMSILIKCRFSSPQRPFCIIYLPGFLLLLRTHDSLSLE